MKKIFFTILSKAPLVEVILRIIWGFVPAKIKKTVLGSEKPARHILPKKNKNFEKICVKKIIDKFDLTKGDTFILIVVAGVQKQWV